MVSNWADSRHTANGAVGKKIGEDSQDSERKGDLMVLNRSPNLFAHWFYVLD